MARAAQVPLVDVVFSSIAPPSVEMTAALPMERLDVVASNLSVPVVPLRTFT